MKKLYILLWLFAMSLILPITAQNESDLPELLDRLSQNHMGSVSDVFSEAEILLLKDHFGETSDEKIIITNLGMPVHATENQTSEFGSFMTTSPGTFNSISNSPVPDFEGAGVYDPYDDVFYVIDDAHNVWVLDPVTGIYGSLGAITPPSGETFTGLEFDPTDGTLYGISTDGAGSTTFSRIDKNTLAVTPIGLTNMILGISLGITNAGGIYSIDIDNDSLYQINKSTGLATLIGFLGFTTSFGSGMFRENLTGNLFITAYNTVLMDSELRLLDVVTGLTVVIGVLIIAVLAQMAWSSMYQPMLAVADNPFNNFKIYPIPSVYELNMEAQRPIERILVYTLEGREVMRQDINATSTQLDVESLASGGYIIKIQIEGETTSYQFLKQ